MQLSLCKVIIEFVCFNFFGKILKFCKSFIQKISLPKGSET